MTSIDAEPLPGTTLSDLIEQDGFLNEFLDLMKKRFELDREYLEKLQALRASSNPKWENSAIWPLISPFLDFLDEETRLRQQTSDSLFARLEELPEHVSPNDPDEQGVTASIKYGRLRPAYNRYQTCLSKVNNGESIALLQSWYRQTRLGSKWAAYMTSKEIAAYVFPEIDRHYRASVVAQHEEVHSAVQWHEERLPNRLEAQQQHAEEVKSLLGDVSTLYSQSSARLAQYSSTMTHSIAAFSPSRSIAPLYRKRNSETLHTLLKPAIYLNFYTNGSPARPIFGLEVSDKVANVFISDPWSYVPPLSIVEAFSIEKNLEVTPISCSHPYWSNSTFRRKAMILSFFSAPPLISLPKDILRLREDTWTRSKLKASMREVSDEAKDIMHRWALAETNLLDDATLLFHDERAWRLVEAIRRKWDFDNDSPLPDGVIREWYSRPLKPKLIWKKTRELYAPP